MALQEAEETETKTGEGGDSDSLADQQNVDGAKIEVIEKRQGGQAIVAGMLARVELWRVSWMCRRK